MHRTYSDAMTNQYIPTRHHFDKPMTKKGLFSDCIDSMDCHMMAGMTTGVSAGSEAALFMHQMIPHHQNAVNMAKALLKTGTLDCPDILEETADCGLEVILREIVSGQNAQIQAMRGYLEESGYPETDDCKVEISPPTLMDPDILKPPTSNLPVPEKNQIPSVPISDGPCQATCVTLDSGNEECIFTAKVNLFASELGYYSFEECGDAVNPTLGMEVGKTYRFIQGDRSNYYHPLGWAYYPDGAHDDVDELEPGIKPPGSTSACADDMSCPAPMYFLDGNYLGEYSNDASIASLTTGADNFGLDDYEPLFFHPLPDWTDYGEFSVTLKFDTEDFMDDIFYFCHIHQFMTGRIKLLKGGVAISDADAPEIPYSYDMPSEYDEQCGTFGLSDWQLPNAECPDRFVCGAEEPGNPELAAFSDCIDSMDCHMMAGMTTGVSAGSEAALFMHQMIPHHQNAVNMAKALLKTGTLDCPDILEETADCGLEVILREIVSGQNAQIQAMRGYLEESGYPETDDCKVEISPPVDPEVMAPAPSALNPPAPEPIQSPPAPTTAGSDTSSGRFVSSSVGLFVSIIAAATLSPLKFM